jgi:hypothetical protein
MGEERRGTNLSDVARYFVNKLKSAKKDISDFESYVDHLRFTRSLERNRRRLFRKMEVSILFVHGEEYRITKATPRLHGTINAFF